jgi:hypothetical protein
LTRSGFAREALCVAAVGVLVYGAYCDADGAGLGTWPGWWRLVSSNRVRWFGAAGGLSHSGRVADGPPGKPTKGPTAIRPGPKFTARCLCGLVICTHLVVVWPDGAVIDRVSQAVEDWAVARH